MRNIISITVSADHRVCCPEWDIARTGENECTRFEITLAEELSTYSAYIDFEKPDGEKFKTPRLNIENNRIIYDLPSAVLDVKGNLLVQLVLQNDEGEITQITFELTYSPNNGTVVWRDSKGRSKIADPVDNKDIANKEYVDNAIATVAVLVSPNGTKYKLTVADDGTLSTAKVD